MKKLIAFIVATLTLILSLSSCAPVSDDVKDDQNGGDHIHSFIEKGDDEWHFMECSCGEIKDKIAHSFEWIVDIEPTYTTSGLKHKECDKCGHKIDEGTVIEQLNTSLLQKAFYDSTQLCDFYNENTGKPEGGFLFIDLSIAEENRIYVQNPFGDPLYFLAYEGENGTISNPTLITYYTIYSEELGSDTDEDVLYHSFTLKMVSTPQNSFSKEMIYEFLPYEKQGEMWNYIVKIYSENECVAEMYYYTILDIDREWMISFLSEYIRRV